MNYKIIIVIILLIFVLLIGGFFLRSGNILIEFKEKLYSRFENIYQLKLEVGEATFWPLNQLILHEVKINTNDNKIILSAPEIKIYYDFIKLISNRKDWLGSINYIKINNPRLKFNDFLNLKSQLINYESNVKKAFLKSLPPELNIVNAYLSLADGEEQIELDKLSGSVRFLNEGGDLKLSLQTKLKIDRLQYDDYFINNLSIEQFDLVVSYIQGQWQGSLQTNFFNLENLPVMIRELPFSLSKVKGKGKLALNFTGGKNSLKEYNGSLMLKDGSGILAIDNYLESELLDNLNGELIINSKKRKLFLKGFQFDFAKNPYYFNGSLQFADKGLPTIYGCLTTNKLQLNKLGLYFPILKDDLKLDGLAQMKLTLTGDLFDPDLSLDFYLPVGEIDGQMINNLKTHLRYQQGMVYVDSFNLNLNHDNYLSLQGVLDSRSTEYSFELQGTNLGMDLFQNYVETTLSDEIKGRVNTELSLTGKGFDLANLTLVGNLEVLNPEIRGIEFSNLRIALWLADMKLLLQNGVLKNDNGELLFSGEMNLADYKLDLQLAGRGVDIELLNKVLGGNLKDISGFANFTGSISEGLKNPLIELNLMIAKGFLGNYNFSDLEAKLSYQNNNLKIEELVAKSQGASLKGSGLVELTEIYPYIEADLKVEDYSSLYLEEIIGQSLPLQGRMSADLKIVGLLTAPKIKVNLSSTEMTLLLGAKNYPLDEMKLRFNWQKTKPIEIEELLLLQGNSSLTGKGSLNGDDLNLGFTVNNLALANFTLNKDLKGNLNLTGEVKGKIFQPEIRGMISANNLKYRQQKLDNFIGGYYFKENSLVLKDINWRIGDNNYLLTGEIDTLSQDLDLDLTLETQKGVIDDLLNLTGINLPISIDYYLKGILRLKGSLTKPYLLLDLSFFNSDEEDRVWLKGRLGSELALELEGRGVELSKLAFLQDLGINLEGDLDFEGGITGNINDYNLHLNTQMVGGRVNNFLIKEIAGEVRITNSDLLYLKQRMDLPDDSSLDLNGYIPIRARENFDLAVNVNGLPLPLISSIFVSVPDLKGYLDGNILLKGSLAKPNFTGRLFMLGGGVDFGLSEAFSLFKGYLNFSDQTIEVANLKGKYGEGELTINGRIMPFNSKNIWDLDFKGKDLPLNYGSFNGRFDSKGKIIGSLFQPLITADLLVHDFIISPPFSWPVSQNKLIKFQPNLDLVLQPGDNSYLKNDNMEILIKDGSLNLTYLDKELEFEGIIKTEQGSFDYYNNKFILDSAKAVFSKLNGYIPYLLVKAWTQVSGTRIEIQLEGQADNLLTTLKSQPLLTKEEILALLVSKGGLGEFVTENWGNIIKKEFSRRINEFFQIDLINDFETKLKNAFSLDRLEIDTYNLGWDQEITVYLGKYLNDRVYLQYSSTFTPEEREDELDLHYYLKDNTIFKSSWRGKEDYRLSIETNIEF